MATLNVHRDLHDALARFELPEKPGFGQTFAPVMYRVDYQDGAWGDGALIPYGPIALDPAAKVLHYAQSVFEGLKAYRRAGERSRIFRPHANWERLSRSALRLSMPAVPEDLFMQGVGALTAVCEPCIPLGRDHALYLRPLLFGTEASLGLQSSDSFSFIVIASPVEAVATGTLRVLIEREGARALAGGTGSVKVSGNYAASLLTTGAATQQGFNQPLWLDAVQHRYIEELSIMNFFAVIDGQIHTPELGDTVLPGVTRDSLMVLARTAGHTVVERKMDIGEFQDLVRNGRCSEAFACGTAVIVAPIGAIGDSDGSVLEIATPVESVALALRGELLDIQTGEVPDRFGWLAATPPTPLPDIR